MNDPYLSRGWAEGHRTFTSRLGKLLDEARIAFERLAARNYDAPWRAEDARQRRPGSTMGWH